MSCTRSTAMSWRSCRVRRSRPSSPRNSSCRVRIPQRSSTASFAMKLRSSPRCSRISRSDFVGAGLKPAPTLRTSTRDFSRSVVDACAGCPPSRPKLHVPQRSLDLRIEQFLRMPGVHVRPGDDAGGGIDTGRYLFTLRGGARGPDALVTHAERVLHKEHGDDDILDAITD